ncbi:MAG: hypothetical protein MJ157_05795 [Clostridia bacterium]|nr:hypothetical protein [Clostridia bacterium]
MYWENKGLKNTDATLQAALQTAQERNIQYLVVATCSGETAAKLLGSPVKVIAVTHHAGFSEPGKLSMAPEMQEKLEASGIKVLRTSHLLSGVERAVRNTFGGIYPAEIMAQTLRMLGQGVKVCVEIAGMALDAGLIPAGKDIIAIGGSVRGADTAIIIEPAHSNRFFETKVKEIICKPRNI